MRPSGQTFDFISVKGRDYTQGFVDFMAKAVAKYSGAIAKSLKKKEHLQSGSNIELLQQSKLLYLLQQRGEHERTSAGTRVEAGMRRTLKTMIQSERRSFVRNNCFQRKKIGDSERLRTRRLCVNQLTVASASETVSGSAWASSHPLCPAALLGSVPSCP